MTRRFDLHLLGPVRLFAPGGDDVTPRGMKARGLLAILAMARGRPLHRATLQDRLWSDRGEAHGRDSLKKALAELRRAFGEDAPATLRMEGGTVALAPERIEVDAFGPAAGDPFAPEFLEGIPIHDEVFTAWLRQTRSELSRGRPGSRGGVEPPRAIATRYALALGPVRHVEGDSLGHMLGDVLLSRLAASFRAFDFFDLRDARDGGANAGGDDGIGPDATLDCRVLTASDRVMLAFGLRRAGDHRLIWSATRQFETARLRGSQLDICASELADQVVGALSRPESLGDPSWHLAARHAIEGIERILDRGRYDLAAASRALRRAIEIEPRGSYYAWYAFLHAHQLEASKGTTRAEIREHADMVCARALERDPHNGLSRSLLTHVYGFVFHDFDRAHELIDPLEASPPDTPMYHYAHGLLRFYTGRLDAARGAIARACRIGRYNPYAYAFSSALCMVEAIRGASDDAIRFGEESLSREQRTGTSFEPTLRYLALAHARAGNTGTAREIWQRIRRQSPGFSAAQLRDRRFPIPLDSARQAMLACFETLDRPEI